jgi:hypothetical protein
VSAEVGLIELAPAYAWPNSGQPPEFGRDTGAGDPVVTAAPFIAYLQVTGCPASTGHDKGVVDPVEARRAL